MSVTVTDTWWIPETSGMVLLGLLFSNTARARRLAEYDDRQHRAQLCASPTHHAVPTPDSQLPSPIARRPGRV
jgi:hypothetical protein